MGIGFGSKIVAIFHVGSRPTSEVAREKWMVLPFSEDSANLEKMDRCNIPVILQCITILVLDVTFLP